MIDRENEITDYARAVGIDDESLRTCQTIGLVQEMLADTLQNMPIRYYTSWGRCFAHVEPSARPYGWARRNLFLQPLLERTLRDGVKRFPDPGVDVIVLRPDRYVAATCARSDFAATTDALRATFGCPSGSG